jgi:hypothetical protein
MDCTQKEIIVASARSLVTQSVYMCLFEGRRPTESLHRYSVDGSKLRSEREAERDLDLDCHLQSTPMPGSNAYQ